MEALPPETSIFATIVPTFAAYEPLLSARADTILATPRTTHAYGPHPRQVVDVYTPPSSPSTSTETPPVLLYLYGGGFVRGARTVSLPYPPALSSSLPPSQSPSPSSPSSPPDPPTPPPASDPDPDPATASTPPKSDPATAPPPPHWPSSPIAQGTVYANVGHFFATRFGCVVCVLDYRLMQHGAVYPSGAEDLALAVKWAGERFGSESEGKEKVDEKEGEVKRRLWIMGNSAGGVHLATWLFAPEFAGSRASVLPSPSPSSTPTTSATEKTGKGLTLTAAVLLSVPFDYADAHADRRQTHNAYYGSEALKAERAPTGLLQFVPIQGQADSVARLRMLAVNGTLDPEDEILGPLRRFVKSAVEVGLKVRTEVMEGHNHISPPLSLGTGIGREEEWGVMVGEWLVGGE